VPRTVDLEKANRIADELRDDIRREIPNVDRVRIDLRVERKQMVVCAAPLPGIKNLMEAERELQSYISDNL
jgi:hypothetical protein